MRKPFHPFLFAIYIVLLQYAVNQNLFPFWVVYSPVTKALAAIAVTYLVFFLLLKNSHYAAVAVSLILCSIVFYGRIINEYYPEITIKGHTLSPQLALGIPLTLFCLVFLWLCRNTLRGFLPELTRIANLVAIILCSIGIGIIVFFALRIGEFEWRRHSLPSSPVLKLTDAEMSRMPHVFHIVLDEYGQEANLRELYGYDNSSFINALQHLGFYVADHAEANYSNTAPAIASLLNYEHMPKLAEGVSGNYTSYASINKLILECRLKNLLHEHGYQFIVLPSGFYFTDIPQSSDIFIHHSRQSEFERTLLDLTIAPTTKKLRERERRRVIGAFNTLPELAQSKEPLYVFAHILAPHPPFVFTETGNDPDYRNFYGQLSSDDLIKESKISRREYGRRYIAQLNYINQLTLKAIRGIMKNAANPPAIFIHGDHGGGAYATHEDPEQTYFKDRFGILCAVYLPKGQKQFYSTITPVNALIILLNSVLNLEIPRLEDRSYFVSPSHPYRYKDSTYFIGSEEDRRRLERMIRNASSGPQ